MENLTNREKQIIKDIINKGYRMLLYKYSEEELNSVVKKIFDKIK